MAFYAEQSRLKGIYPTAYFALFIGAAFVGAYPTYEAALDEGYTQAEGADFFVKQIEAETEVHCIVGPVVAS